MYISLHFDSTRRYCTRIIGKRDGFRGLTIDLSTYYHYVFVQCGKNRIDFLVLIIGRLDPGDIFYGSV